MTPETIQIKVLEGTKFCPFLPPIPLMQMNPLNSKAQPSIVGFMGTPCPGSTCARYDSCQGKHSPSMLIRKLAKISAILIQGLSSAPFIGPAVEGLVPLLASELGLSDDESTGPKSA